MPLSLLSQGNGTVIFFEKACLPGANHCSFSPASCGSKSKAHWPLRLTHGLRWKSGRGCSGHGMSAAKAVMLNSPVTMLVLMIAFLMGHNVTQPEAFRQRAGRGTMPVRAHRTWASQGELRMTKPG